MIAAPRLPTFGRSPLRSTPDRRRRAACLRAPAREQIWVHRRRVFPTRPSASRRDRTSSFAASWAIGGCVESQHRRKTLVRDVLRVVHRDQAVRVRGCPRRHFQVVGGLLVQALPWTVRSSRSRSTLARSMPFVLGSEPTSSANVLTSRQRSTRSQRTRIRRSPSARPPSAHSPARISSRRNRTRSGPSSCPEHAEHRGCSRSARRAGDGHTY